MNNIATPFTVAHRSHSFGRCTADGHKLFNVAAGVPAKEALEHINFILESAWSVAFDISMKCDADTSVLAVINLIEMSRAAIWAVGGAA